MMTNNHISYRGVIGSITFLAPTGGTEAENVINHHDMGREVQLSFYAGQ